MPPASSKPIPQIPPYGDTAIEVDRLHFAYRGADSGSIYDPNHPDNVVLQDLNLSLRKGSRCLLIGANGSGKSVRSPPPSMMIHPLVVVVVVAIGARQQ
jgi:ABC-type multidrug transport system fused ATPase/permease subunit